MAARVVWLVANGHVRPEEVLGLTFTRKAAGELAERVRSRLRALRRRLRVPGEQLADEAVVAGLHLPLLRRGRRSPITGCGSASSRGRSCSARLRPGSSPHEVVQAWDADLGVADRTPTTVTEALLGLAGECAEHLVEPGERGRVHRCADRADRAASGRRRGSGAR